MYGWAGRILRIDLTKGDIKHEDLDSRVVKDYVGGRGLGIYYMLREVEPTCDPLGSKNKLMAHLKAREKDRSMRRSILSDLTAVWTTWRP